MEKKVFYRCPMYMLPCFLLYVSLTACWGTGARYKCKPQDWRECYLNEETLRDFGLQDRIASWQYRDSVSGAIYTVTRVGYTRKIQIPSKYWDFGPTEPEDCVKPEHLNLNTKLSPDYTTIKNYSSAVFRVSGISIWCRIGTDFSQIVGNYWNIFGGNGVYKYGNNIEKDTIPVKYLNSLTVGDSTYNNVLYVKGYEISSTTKLTGEYYIARDIGIVKYRVPFFSFDTIPTVLELINYQLK